MFTVHRQHGSPGIGIYISYIRAAGGICLFLVSVLVCVVFHSVLKCKDRFGYISIHVHEP